MSAKLEWKVPKAFEPVRLAFGEQLDLYLVLYPLFDGQDPPKDGFHHWQFLISHKDEKLHVTAGGYDLVKKTSERPDGQAARALATVRVRNVCLRERNESRARIRLASILDPQRVHLAMLTTQPLDAPTTYTPEDWAKAAYFNLNLNPRWFGESLPEWDVIKAKLMAYAEEKWATGRLMSAEKYYAAQNPGTDASLVQEMCTWCAIENRELHA
ncbi:hypothetical protein S40293_10581 [Stachybotrys chartarum IBT 40293]|nr:hypothetical protein S40293_10581 [Stachybotrys chartarum IBT 40293]